MNFSQWMPVKSLEQTKQELANSGFKSASSKAPSYSYSVSTLTKNPICELKQRAISSPFADVCGHPLNANTIGQEGEDGYYGDRGGYGRGHAGHGCLDARNTRRKAMTRPYRPYREILGSGLTYRSTTVEHDSINRVADERYTQ